jgi:hypothetical protein
MILFVDLKIGFLHTLSWNIEDEFPKIKTPKKQYGGQIQNGGQPENYFLSNCAFCDLIC